MQYTSDLCFTYYELYGQMISVTEQPVRGQHFWHGQDVAIQRDGAYVQNVSVCFCRGM